MTSTEQETLPYHLQRDRSRIPEKYTWRLTDIYADDGVWRSRKEDLVRTVGDVAAFKGRLASSPGVLFDCLDLVSRLSKEYSRLYCYASLNSDLDTRDAVYLGMEQEMNLVGTGLSSATAFVQPEIIASFTPELIRRFLEEDPRLQVYRHGLDDLMRRKQHTRTEGEEEVIAEAGLMSDAPHTIFSVLVNADFPFPEVTLSNGTTVRLDQAAFALHRASPNREDRRKVFGAFFGRMNEFRRTFGAQLSSQVMNDLFYMKARRYGSCLERALDEGNIPVGVFRSLVDQVNANLTTFHRYLRLRRRILEVDELHIYDLYAPLVRDLDLAYTIESSMEHILNSLEPLGEEYLRIARSGFADRWVDVFPTQGKRSGAYSNGGVYDVHPYMLLNFNGKYDDMSTLTHELGHTMHSHFSNTRQPYPTARYAIFVAEVASTFNEALLLDHMLKNVKDDAVRLSLLGNYLDGVRGTIFRQTQFSEFELAIHEKAERGEPLTGDSLCALYQEISRRYHGHEQGICRVDDDLSIEWAYVPHFYYNFYVYQYATSFTASAAIAEKVLSGNTDARDLYLELLSSGGSDYPVNLLRKAGVDLTTSEPFELTMKQVNRALDQVEAILGDKGKQNRSGA
jgi:oligoendopeptidase F